MPLSEAAKTAKTRPRFSPYPSGGGPGWGGALHRRFLVRTPLPSPPPKGWREPALLSSPSGAGVGASRGTVITSRMPLGNPIAPTPEHAPKHAANCLWAVPIARIYEVFPLLCPMCGGQMRLIAFINEGTQVRRFLDHIGVDSEPVHISPGARITAVG